jgi:pimeloyl-ACP methyl ester carboxylesterase
VLRLHLREAWAWGVLAAWAVRAALRDRLHVPAGADGPPVLCVHGFTQNGTNFWGIRRELHARRRATRAVFLGRPFQPLVGYMPALERALDELVGRFPDRPVDVVCHSMGGVILRLVLARRQDLAGRIGRIVTLGSPHRGTASPRGVAWFADVRELSRRSPVLAHLPGLPELAPAARLTTIASTRDFIVYPHDSALVPGAEQALFHDVGHAGLLVHPEVVAEVVRAVHGTERVRAAS